ncbi:sensor histidine kinase [Nocardioides marmoraquaticus]
MILALTAPGVALAGAEDATTIAALAVVIGVFSTVSRHPLLQLVPALLGTAGLLILGGAMAIASYDTLSQGDLIGLTLQYVGTLLLTILAATWVRAQREVRTARAAEDRAVAREHHAMVHAALARERANMARELHDIAAHHLSAIAVLAAAVERQIVTDPAAATEAVVKVRAQSTATLSDLRRLIGLLREPGSGDTLGPEALGSLPELVARVAATGVDVQFTADGRQFVADGQDDPGRGVGPLAQLAAYRAVQEALANAARHAPGAACEVDLDARAPHAVIVTVRNGRPCAPAASSSNGPSRGGYGLLGMRERAQLTGADLKAGPTDDGGWQVTMRLPREPVAAAP